jgi:DNA-binding MarR family transcriptional regulator
MVKGRAVQARAVVEPFPAGGDVLEFLRLIWAIDEGVQKTSKRMQRTLGVTGPQRFALRLIGLFPGLTVARLAEWMCVHPSTVSGIVERLVQRELVDRRTDPRDRRRAFLGLTGKGRALVGHSRGTIEAAIKQALSGLPKQRLDHARAVLVALARALANNVSPASPRRV